MLYKLGKGIMLIFVSEKNRPLLLAKGVSPPISLDKLSLGILFQVCIRNSGLCSLVQRDGESDLMIFFIKCVWRVDHLTVFHYHDVTMDTVASHITSLTIVCTAVYSRRRSKKTSKLLVTGLCAGKPPVTGEFPAQGASNGKMFPFYDVIMIIIFRR